MEDPATLQIPKTVAPLSLASSIAANTGAGSNSSSREESRIRAKHAGGVNSSCHGCRG